MDFVLVSKEQHDIDPDERLLDAAELARYRRFLTPTKQLEFLAGRTFLKTELAAYLNVAPQQIFLATTERGKPYLPAVYGHQRPHFSLSHSGSSYLLGLSAYPIGVDLEGKRPVNVAHHRPFLAAAEQATLLALPEPVRSAQFLRLFTAKEAFLKATDKQWPLHDIQFAFDGADWRLQHPAGPYQFHQIETATHWQAVCLQTT